MEPQTFNYYSDSAFNHPEKGYSFGFKFKNVHKLLMDHISNQTQTPSLNTPSQMSFVWIYFKKSTRYHVSHFSSGEAASSCHCPLQGLVSLEHLALISPYENGLKSLFEPRFECVFSEGKIFEPRFECPFYERKPFEPPFPSRTARGRKAHLHPSTKAASQVSSFIPLSYSPFTIVTPVSSAH